PANRSDGSGSCSSSAEPSTTTRLIPGDHHHPADDGRCRALAFHPRASTVWGNGPGQTTDWSQLDTLLDTRPTPPRLLRRRPSPVPWPTCAARPRPPQGRSVRAPGGAVG